MNQKIIISVSVACKAVFKSFINVLEVQFDGENIDFLLSVPRQ